MSSKEELPAGLAWSNSLARIDGVGLLVRAREEYKKMLEVSPDDQELRERVRGHIQEVRTGLEQLPDTDKMLEAIGTPEEILGS